MIPPLTKGAHRVLKCLHELTLRLGRPPTGEEIAKKLKMSRQSVHEHMRILVASGRVELRKAGPWYITRSGEAEL